LTGATDGQDRWARTPRYLLAAVVAFALLWALLAATATPTPTGTSIAVSTSPASGGYGSGIAMDALNNTPIGGPDAITSSNRFRADTSSALDSIRTYITDGVGYAGGDGGTMEITIQPDDDSSIHAPSGRTLASTSIRPGNPISIGPLPSITFATPAITTAGRLYHVVFRNTDPMPTINYISLDGIYMYQPTSPRQPRFSDVDWGQPTRDGSGPWADQDRTVPILQLEYANGTVQGEGHIQVWVGSPKDISGGAVAREAFVVTGSSRTVSSVAVRLTRVSGTGPLTVRLETTDGSLVDQGTILATAIPIGIPGSHPGPGQATWATCTFAAPRTLTSGEGYNLVLSAPADAIYSIFVLRKGRDYGFSPATYFGDGHAQYNPGSGWMFFDQTGGTPNTDEGDLQFYFR
jgi:hypothetical protein